MNETVEEKLAGLRKRFAQSLPRRLEAIESALSGDSSVIERLLHSLAGTAGTSGFMAISNLARLAEEHYADGARVRAIVAELGAAAGQAEACPTQGKVQPPS